MALVAPFATLAGFIAPVLEGGLGETAAWTVASVLCFGPLTMATGMLASVRDLEIAAVRRLLGVGLADAAGLDVQMSWSTRWRSAAWFLAHLVAERGWSSPAFVDT